ncbi:MAG: lipid kinase [Chloroflexaceae bacterium]|nr:lipid kinase [Chloroflexaceae bacterium]
MRALLLINPYSRQGKKAQGSVKQHLEAVGVDVLEKTPQTPAQFSQLIHRYHPQVDCAIIGGGDGTLNAALPGLIATQLPLGVLPLGTANDLARTLHIPTSLPLACQAIAAGRIQRIDLGWVNGQYFFNVASCGLSVKITQKLSHQAKQRWGVFAYALTAWQVLRKSRPFTAEIVTPTQILTVKTIQIAVGNGRYYGGGLSVAPDAAIDDARLDTYSLEVKHWWQVLWFLPALWLGPRNTALGMRTLDGEEITIRTRRSQPITIDGELATHTPATFRVIPKLLPVFVPDTSESQAIAL